MRVAKRVSSRRELALARYDDAMRSQVLLVCMASLALAANSAALAQEARREVFVAPNGDDSNPGTRAKPLATLARARDLVRERHVGQAQHTLIDVVLLAGRYELAETLKLGPEDSWTRWKSSDGDHVFVSGGRALDPFLVSYDGLGNRTVSRAGLPDGVGAPLVPISEDNLQTWVAKLPDGADRRQVFVRDERRPVVRLPRDGFFRVASLPDANEKTPWNEGQKSFVFADGDLHDWDGLVGDAEIIAYHFWIESRMPVASIDLSKKRVELGKRAIFRLTDDHGPAFARYRVENVVGCLEKRGEWATSRGYVCYLARTDEQGNQRTLTVPVLRHLIDLEGDPDHDRFVEGVQFDGLVFEHSLAESTPVGWPSSDVAGPPQAAVTAPGAIRFFGARRCAIKNSFLQHLGSYAIELDAGCQEDTIAYNVMRDLGGGGVKVGETSHASNPARIVKQNAITDNQIQDGGSIFPSAVGVLVLDASETTVAHNDIHDLYYTGISVGWSWGYGESGAFGNVIEKNHVHHIGRGLLSDMGAIYLLGVAPGTVVRGNVLHDVESYSYGGWGIYFDEGTSGVVAENNLVYRCKSAGFHQHYGKENIVRNNVFASSREAQIARSRAEPHRSFTFSNNIVYWSEGNLLAGTWEGDGYLFEHNDYWCTKGDVALASLPTHAQEHMSIVSDPLFVDVAHDDFRLKPESPALTRMIGFQPVDWRDVGPRFGKTK